MSLIWRNGKLIDSNMAEESGIDWVNISFDDREDYEDQFEDQEFDFFRSELD